MILQVDQSTQMELLRALSRWRGLYTTEFTGTACLEEFLQILDSPCRFPDFSSWSPLLYSSEGVQSVLSGQKSGVTDFYTGAYFDVLVGGGEFSVHYTMDILSLLTILYFDMKSVEGQLHSQILINTSSHQVHFVPSFNSNLGLTGHDALLPEEPLQTEKKLHAL